MNLKALIIILAFFWIVAILAFSANYLKADDVYNFYFQKAPGPVSVYQGGGTPGGQAATAPTPAPSPLPNQISTSASTVPAPASTAEVPHTTAKIEEKRPEPAEHKLKHWEFSFGKGGFSMMPAELQLSGHLNSYGLATGYYGQWILGLQYNFSRYLALGGQMMQLQGHPIKVDGETNFDWVLGAVVTPIHVNLFGYSELDLSIIGGMITLPYGDYWYLNDESQGPPVDVHHLMTFFGGLKAALTLSESVSIVGMVKFLPYTGVENNSLALAFNL